MPWLACSQIHCQFAKQVEGKFKTHFGRFVEYFLGAQNKDMGTALQTLRFKPGLNFVSNTGYKRSLHKDSKDGFKDVGFCCIYWGRGFLRVLIIFSCCVTLS